MNEKTILEINDMENMVISINCVNEGCDFTVNLGLHDKGKWKFCKGYLDPVKDFKSPKVFAIRIMEWKGICEKCGREYETSMRIKLGE